MAEKKLVPTHYETLGVSPAASLDEIKKRFRELARVHHPDVAPGKENADRFRKINEAYQVLGDSSKRLNYDSELKLAALKQPRPSSSSPPPRTSSAPPSTPNQTSQRSGSRTAADSRRRKVEAILEEAHKAMRRMRYRDAESLCREALRLDRRCVDAYEILGDIQKVRGNTDEAVAMYSFAMQLDRTNASVRSKFDRLVGQQSGPTMAGHAARSSRPTFRSAPSSETPFLRGNNRLILTGILFGIASFLLLAVAEQSAAAPGFNPFDWHPVLLIGLAVTGMIGGFLLTVNRAIPRCRKELGAAPRQDGKGLAVPVAAIVVALGVAWFWAGLVGYAALCMARRMISPGLVGAFAWCLGACALFAFAAKGGAEHVAMMGGNVAFLFFIAGWLVGDMFRPPTK